MLQMAEKVRNSACYKLSRTLSNYGCGRRKFLPDPETNIIRLLDNQITAPFQSQK